MTADLLALAQSQAETLAALVRKRHGHRRARSHARALLQRLFVLEQSQRPEQSEKPGQSETPGQGDSEGDWVSLCWQLAHSERSLLEDTATSGLAALLVRSPFPERFMKPLTAGRAERLTSDCLDHWRVNLALSEERIAWMEARCQAAAPGLLRPIRQPDPEQSERLTDSEMALLRKRGRSKFS